VNDGSFWQSSLFHWVIAIWVILMVLGAISRAADQGKKKRVLRDW